MDSAVSSTSLISAASRSCMLRRSLRFHPIRSTPLTALTCRGLVHFPYRLASPAAAARREGPGPEVPGTGQFSYPLASPAARQSFCRLLNDYPIRSVVLAEH